MAVKVENTTNTVIYCKNHDYIILISEHTFYNIVFADQFQCVLCLLEKNSFSTHI